MAMTSGDSVVGETEPILARRELSGVGEVSGREELLIRSEAISFHRRANYKKHQNFMKKDTHRAFTSSHWPVVHETS